MQQKIFFVGTSDEIAHHAAPLNNQIDYEIVPPQDVVPVANPGDLAIFFSEHFDRFRDAIADLKTKQVATLYMVDGILEWRNAWENRNDEPACPFTMRPVLCHKVACIGNSQARVLSSWGNRDKVEIVGVARFDALLNQYCSPPAAGNRLLVLTAKFPSYTPEQHDRLVKSLRDLKAFLDSQKGVEVTWRLTAGLDREIGIENRLNDLTGVELAQALAGVDAVVSTPSTAILESMLLGRPTAVLDYTNSPCYLQSAWSITSRDQIESEITSLLAASKQRMLYQHSMLSDAIQISEQSVSRMCALIEAMLNGARTCLENNRPLEFPADLLPAVSPCNSSDWMEHAELFPGYAAFQIDDQIELQTELAHARREILHLQRQLKQIESELSQAHQIFDEINSHPIAGPVVKIRKRIISLIQKLRGTPVHAEPQ